MISYIKLEKLVVCLYVLIIVNIICNSLYSQELYFKNLTVEDGLTQNDVNSILQDSYGFMWVGTYDGLNRYDGRNIETFRRETANLSSIPDNRITALFEDHNKRLWIGTESGFLSYYSLLKDQFIRVKSPDNNRGSIFNFLQASDDALYAITSTGILKLIDSEEPEFEYMPSVKNYHFRDAVQLPEGDILFVGNNGIFQYKNDKFSKLPVPEGLTFTSVIYSGKTVIAGGRKGLFTIENFNRVVKFDGYIIPEASIISMTKDGEGNIWVGTHNHGLLKLDSSLNYVRQITSSRTNPRSLLSNTVLKLYLDRFNNLWVGNRHGLCYTNIRNSGFNSIDLQNIGSLNVRSMAVEESNLILGISNEGLFNYDLKNHLLKEINGLDINFVNQIIKIDDVLYICSDKGLQVLKKDNTLEHVFKNLNEPRNIRCITKDNNGRFFIGTTEGILLKERNSVNWIWEIFPSLENFSQYHIFRMFFDSHSNQLLIGTISKGLKVLNIEADGRLVRDNREVLRDVKGQIIDHTSIWCFHRSKDNTIWIGTDVGLFKRKVNSEFFQQIEVEGVRDKKIMSIAEDSDQNLWLSNSHGLINFNPTTNNVKIYTSDDGLLSSSMTEASGYYEDYILFGTTNGVNYVNPLEISVDPNHPKLLLSNFKINNKLVNPGVETSGSIILTKNINDTDYLRLNHQQNDLSIELSATNYSKIARNNFRYRLDGHHDYWVYTSSNPVISYSNLDPGSYVLEVQVEDNEGNWNNNSIALPISIIPSPWKTTFAYVVYIIIICLVILGFIYFWFQKQKLDHQIELDKIKISQDKQLREKQLRFFVDVGHEFKTPLSLILAPFNDLMNQVLSKEQKQMCLEIVSRNIQRMNFLVNQLIDFGKISEGVNLVQVTKKDLRKSIIEYTKTFQWQVQHEEIDLRLNLDKCEGYFDRSVLEKGFYNILSNAFKYTPTGGIIDITLKVEEENSIEYAIITVSDSGPGVPDAKKELIFERFYHGKDRSSSGIGLHLAQSLIKAHGGNIYVEDSELGGTKFKIVLPISRSFYSDNKVVRVNKDSLNDQYQENFDEEVIDKEETILIVEDDHELRNYLKISLQNEYSIIEANNGEQGLEMAHKNLPDIIISDIMMPIMDGIDMCEKLKSNRDTSHIPLLFLTAKTEIIYQRKGLEAGAWDFITKPFDSEVLRRKVVNILETRNKFKTYLLNQNINLDIKSYYTSYDQKLIKNINQVVESNLDNPNFTVSNLAEEVGLSRMHLHRKLKTLVGETGKSFITQVKIKYAVSMFDNGCDRVQEAMNAVGITNYSNFNNNFKKLMGVTATEYIARLKENSSSM
ncbi:hybrid sensor histidine kinase/response regulator transcription factor [Gaetbulibacter saemankumensis]|uniref:hybrid sensor histidine kinase/response regulator transcription factor n=1 Tax=Gaetbulibacter saemankumensis TaxID=311208 RepID=UPI000404EBBE|nr:two-component regulator propeller domain-containing protein [Gaetbulibacter saemankumensis]